MRSTIARLVASLLVSAGAVGITAGASRAPTSAGAASLSWHQCDKRFRCSSLAVPLDYAKPAEGTIRLALVELPATGRDVVGDLVLNPGGPGGSGVQFLEGTSFPAPLRSSFNLVSFDPRGIGQSDPVTCVGTAQMRRLIALDPDPQTSAQVASVVNATKSFDKACTEHTSARLLDNVGTINTVRDLDRARSALGQRKLNYMGFSYGTYIGELYASLYPHRVRAMVLDGVVDPALSVSAMVSEQAVGFELDLRDFFAWCPGNKSCRRELPQGAQKAYEELYGRVAQGDRLLASLQPKYGGVQRVTLGVFGTAVVGSLYSDQTWPDLAQALQDGLQGNGGLLVALAYSYEGLMVDGQFSNLMAAATAIGCADRPFPSTVPAYQKMAAAAAKAAPDFGALDAWGYLTCAFWPVRAASQPSALHAKGSPPILLIGSTDDPATPYRWAQSVAKQLDRARLLTRTGPGHTGYLYSTCTQRWTDRYLQTLRLPPPHTRCASSS